MVIFGGSPFFNVPNNNSWALSLGATPTWSAIVPVGPLPPARFSHAGMYDSVRDRLIVFGGYSGSFDNDVWALSFAGTPAWSQIFPAGAPPAPRDAMTTFYDPVKDRLLLFGGWATNHFVNDVWQLSLSGIPVWSPVITTGAPPTPRRHYAGVFDTNANRLVITGGEDLSGYRNDTWTLTFDGAGNGTWAPQSPSGTLPTPRAGHRAVFDAAGNRMLVFAGYDNLYRSDLWALQFQGANMSWQLLGAPKSISPPARTLHSSIFVPSQSRVIVFGGVNSADAKNDVWAYDASLNGAAVSRTPVGPSTEAVVSGVQYRLAIAGVSPNPAFGPFEVRFSLADSRPARLSVYSVNGRELLHREVGGLGAGDHTLSLSAGRTMSPGVYLVSWRVISADSHPVGGTYSFRIGPGGPPSVSGCA
jgi:hypothetical protein